MSYVQSRSVWPSTSATTTALAYSAPVTVGSYLWLYAVWNVNTVTATVADSVNGAWAPLSGPQTGVGGLAAFRGQMFGYANSLAGTPTVTLTLSSACTRRGIAIHEYAGIVSAAAVDGSGLYNTPTSTTPSSSPITTAFDNDQLACGICTADSITAATAPFTMRENSNFGGNATSDFVSAAPGSYTASFTTDGLSTHENIIGIVALKPAVQAVFLPPPIIGLQR